MVSHELLFSKLEKWYAPEFHEVMAYYINVKNCIKLLERLIEVIAAINKLMVVINYCTDQGKVVGGKQTKTSNGKAWMKVLRKLYNIVALVLFVNGLNSFKRYYIKFCKCY